MKIQDPLTPISVLVSLVDTVKTVIESQAIGTLIYILLLPIFDILCFGIPNAGQTVK